jgi:hypothetical protein
LSKKFLTPVALPHGIVDPAVGSIGALFYRSDLKEVRAFDGTNWVSTSASTNIDGGSPAGYVDYIYGGTAATVYFESTFDGGDPATTDFSVSYTGGGVVL